LGTREVSGVTNAVESLAASKRASFEPQKCARRNSAYFFSTAPPTKSCFLDSLPRRVGAKLHVGRASGLLDTRARAPGVHYIANKSSSAALHNGHVARNAANELPILQHIDGSASVVRKSKSHREAHIVGTELHAFRNATLAGAKHQHVAVLAYVLDACFRPACLVY
jgi:hypothetical protein